MYTWHLIPHRPFECPFTMALFGFANTETFYEGVQLLWRVSVWSTENKTTYYSTILKSNTRKVNQWNYDDVFI